MLTLLFLVKLGKVYANLMVDVQPTNAKLRQRATRIVAEITGLDLATAKDLLVQANWQTKTAVVMGLADVDAAEATRRLVASAGRVRLALLQPI